jgi:hypothetical protein
MFTKNKLNLQIELQVELQESKFVWEVPLGLKISKFRNSENSEQNLIK